MANCRVYRRANPNITIMAVRGLDGSLATPRMRRTWVGVCEVCGNTVAGRGGWWGAPVTRKVVRDDLYHHMRTKHAGPGGTS